LERLNRFLARSGVASRRGADDLISSGSVLVNGDRPPPSGVLVDPDRDVVTVDGLVVKPRIKHRYLMLNKPLGVITTAKDEASRPTVLDAVGDEGMAGHRLFPVGRLDADTTASSPSVSRIRATRLPRNTSRSSWAARMGRTSSP